MDIFEHLAKIEGMAQEDANKPSDMINPHMQNENNQAMGASFAGRAGTLHSNVFGGIYSGNNPFQVGGIGNFGYSGNLHADNFGHVRVGDSPFISGRINNHGNSGELHNDQFGNIHIGHSPFKIGEL